MLAGATERAEVLGRGPRDRGLIVEVLDWAAVTNLGEPIHLRHWGQQTPEQIARRLTMARDWLDDAQRLGPIDGAASGGAAPITRPSWAAPFPNELIPWAKLSAHATTDADRRRAWQATVDYAAVRRRHEFAPKAGIAWRVANALARPELHEPVLRPA